MKRPNSQVRTARVIQRRTTPAQRRSREEAEARHTRWVAEQLERDQADLATLERRNRARAWRQIVSDALDDRQLEAAIEHVTTPVGGLGRRSVPLARAQLLAWAVDVRRREPDAPLDKALQASLEGEPHPVDTIGGPPPPAPYAAPDARDLSARIEDALARRPDLDRPAQCTVVELQPRSARLGLDLER